MMSTPSNPFDDTDALAAPPKSSPGGGGEAYTKQKADTQERRARRRREEAVSRLVADATRPPDFLLEESTAAAAAAATATDDLFGNSTTNTKIDDEYSNHAIETAKLEARLRSQQHSTLLLASTVASSIERGLDRELHSELTRQGKEAQSVISKICHDHSEDFLESVGKVVAALGGPCEEVKNSLEEVSFVIIIRFLFLLCYPFCILLLYIKCWVFVDDDQVWEGRRTHDMCNFAEEQ